MKKYLYLLGSAIACVFVMAACSNGSGSSNATTCTANAAGCVYSSQYGWLSQSGCAVGQGMYNNSCVIVTGGGYGYGGYGQQCYAGQIQTQYGCLSQGGCPAGQAYYQGQCVLGTAGGYGYYGQQSYQYGYGYSSYYGYGGGCRVGSALGGFINYYTCGY